MAAGRVEIGARGRLLSAVWNGGDEVGLEQLTPLYLTALGALRPSE